MLFSEFYSSYYNAVAEILSLAVKGELTDRDMYEVVSRKAFSESVMTIPQNLKNGDWKLLCEDNTTPVKNPPTMPLTELQKRWLKSLLSDPRIQLFSPSVNGLENVKPLFDEDTFVYFDRYSDGDPYTSADYIELFKTVLTALKEKRKLLMNFTSHNGHRLSWVCVPERLVYSSKDDKFRLATFSKRRNLTVNLARVRSCRLLEPYTEEEFCPRENPKKELTLELYNKRNALERVMLHFSHLEKETRKLSDEHYRVTLKYYQEDETEILIRVLSFGPIIKVISPDSFINQIKQRLNKQNSLRA